MILINVNIIGQTPLHDAADRGHNDCMTLLLNSGAEVNAKDNKGDNISYSSLNSIFVMNELVHIVIMIVIIQ